ncbi:adipose-secreted signaling protein-like isoform X1 [Tachypleus tridentatus]|uniref:adipose-secreted signaling protein-like isoform X1 n=1 Tax=Tachypleus tridentatus TaxID=6853 RepID=UPI003FD56A92
MHYFGVIDHYIGHSLWTLDLLMKRDTFSNNLFCSVNNPCCLSESNMEVEEHFGVLESVGQHRVHFNEESDYFGHDANIIVHPLNDMHINVHLGFLQIHHRYQVSFVFHSRETAGLLAVRSQNPPNLNLRVTDLCPVEGAHEGPEIPYRITLELIAYKEKLLREQVLLEACGSSIFIITLLLHARVLGKGKGTPFLKNGIRCIGQEMDEEESEYSVWQGYD